MRTKDIFVRPSHTVTDDINDRYDDEFTAEEAAENGEVDAQYLLGKMYLDYNMERAVSFLILASSQDHPDATFILHNIMENLSKDEISKIDSFSNLNSQELFEKALGLNSKSARLKKADQLFLTGEQSKQQAGVNLLEELLEDGDDRAVELLFTIADQIQPDGVKLNDPQYYLEKAAELGNKDALYRVTMNQLITEASDSEDSDKDKLIEHIDTMIKLTEQGHQPAALFLQSFGFRVFNIGPVTCAGFPA